MNGLRKFGVGLSVVLFSVSITVVVILSSLVLTVGKPQTVKTWLSEADLYSSISKTIATQIKQTVNTEAGAVDSSQPQIQSALVSALSTKFLQTTTEKVVDGTYKWLEGDVKVPDFTIDISDIKQTFAQKVGEYAKNRYESLPNCARGYAPNTSDIFNIECKIIGYDINPFIQKIVQNIKSSQDFLPSNVITAENLYELQSKNNSDNNDKKDSFSFEKLNAIPTNYQRAKLANTIFITLALVFGALAIILSASKKQGTKRVGRALLSAGIVFTISGILMGWTADKIKLFEIPNNDIQALQESIQKLSSLVIKDSSKIMLIFGVSYLVVGLGTILIIHFTNKNKKAAEKPEVKEELSAGKPKEKEPETKNSDKIPG